MTEKTGSAAYKPQAFLIKYAEIGIKGKNRYVFEDALIKQMRYALKKVEGEFEVSKTQGRVHVECLSDYDYDEVTQALSRVFGITGICPVVHVKDEGFDRLAEDVIRYMEDEYRLKRTDGEQAGSSGEADDKEKLTFKVNCRRARKNYPMDSQEVNMAMGERILDAFGVKGPNRHIINGHVPIHVSKGENPIKASGMLMVIDGGFSEAYHKETGIAGYTLVYHSRGFQLVQHEPFTSAQDAILRGTDIKSPTQIVEMSAHRMLVADTDKGEELRTQISELKDLLYAYRHGIIKERR